MTKGPDMPDALSEENIEELIANAREEFAECHAEDCNSYGSGYAAAEIDVWQKVLPVIASDRAEIARLKGNQRTKGTVEVCKHRISMGPIKDYCDFTEDEWGDCKEPDCPIRQSPESP